MRTKPDTFRLLIFSAFLFFTASYMEDSLPAGQAFTALALVLMAASFLAGSTDGLKVTVTGFEVYFIVFIGYCALSTLWAADASRTMIVVRAMLVAFVMMFIVHTCFNGRTQTGDLMKAVISVPREGEMFFQYQADIMRDRKSVV